MPITITFASGRIFGLDGRPITNLVNTHANGDHCYGNELVPDREEIYATLGIESPYIPWGIHPELLEIREQLEGGRLPSWQDVRTALATTWPMVSASVSPSRPK